MAPKPVKVTHSRGSYPIEFGSVDGLGDILTGDIVIVTDSNLFKLYGHLLKGLKVVLAPAGERSKSLGWYGRLLNELTGHKVSRKTKLVALGGGVIGDLGGFLAATYMRGLDYIQVPTSLLAMVDSSVGGKVGIDLPGGKNLAGAFWPPSRVLISADFLKTLPSKQFKNGMAEVWKYAYIADAGLLEKLRSQKAQPLEIIDRCVRIKAEIVAKDEFETTGLRAILNFGHTVGHAIESEYGYGKILHGQAIAIGMVKEAEIGERLGHTPAGTANEIRKDLMKQGLPVDIPKGVDSHKLIDLMKVDKKASQGQISMSLLTGLGESKLFHGVDESVVLLSL